MTAVAAVICLTSATPKAWKSVVLQPQLKRAFYLLLRLTIVLGNQTVAHLLINYRAGLQLRFESRAMIG